ncbi:MAG: YdiU family protein [Planctomycetota bacterium]
MDPAARTPHEPSVSPCFDGGSDGGSDGGPARGLDRLNFDNAFTRELPADPETGGRRRIVEGACYSRVKPRRPRAPELVAHSREVAALLGLDDATCRSEAFVRVFSGAEVLPGMDPYAMCYGGHQFGHWARQLGDGRAINLGQVLVDGAAAGDAAATQGPERWILQLKGAGATPYSRTADGLAVLRSSVREFLCSEAMHHLGVPTTRALSLITTGDRVVRDMFYDGNAEEEPGAVVCRVARSFTRFGNFELPASRGDVALLRALAEHTIRRELPHLDAPREGALTPEHFTRFFADVAHTTAEMVAQWMRVGFVHGVMNTDNMSIRGETIDYGPYGWLEGYDPSWTPNTTDAEGRRYAFGNQPAIAHWNLCRLGGALVPLIGDVAPVQALADAFPARFAARNAALTAAKLGFESFEEALDGPLFAELQRVLQLAETDMTLLFRALVDVDITRVEVAAGEALAPLMDAFYDTAALTDDVRGAWAAWLSQYRARARQDDSTPAERAARMCAANPRFVLRNYLAQVAIDAATKGDPSQVRDLLETLRRPYAEQPERAHHALKRPEWARHRAGCSMLSCSS